MAKNNFPPLLHLTYVLQQICDETLTQHVGVGLSQVRIMSALGTAPVSQRAIASSLRQTEANVSRQLRAMKSSGLVSIARNKKDHRQRDVTLTRKGATKYGKAASLLKRQSGRMFKQIGATEANLMLLELDKY